MQHYLPFVVLGLAFAALVAWRTLKSRRARAAETHKLAQIGFTPCDIGALGPEGNTLYDLTDNATLSLVQNVGDCGALILMCRGEWCSLSSPSAQMPFDLDKIWPVVRELV